MSRELVERVARSLYDSDRRRAELALGQSFAPDWEHAAETTRAARLEDAHAALEAALSAQGADDRILPEQSDYNLGFNAGRLWEQSWRREIAAPVSAPTAEAAEAAHLCVALVGPGCVGCVNYKAGMEAGREYERALRQPQVTEEMRQALLEVISESRESGPTSDGYDTIVCAACDAVLVVDGKPTEGHSLSCRIEYLERLTAAINGKGEK